MLSGKLNLFVHYENWSMNMTTLYLCISVTVWSCTFVVYIGVYCWYVCMHCSNCLTNTTSALFWGWRNVTSVFARGRVWRSEGHVLLGLAREFFCVCCSRSARSKHVFLKFLVVQYRRGVVSHVWVIRWWYCWSVVVVLLPSARLCGKSAIVCDSDVLCVECTEYSMESITLYVVCVCLVLSIFVCFFIIYT